MKNILFLGLFFVSTLSFGQNLLFGIDQPSTDNAPAMESHSDSQGMNAADASRDGSSQAPSCTCHGGPGNYTYSCPAVAQTCYGGPGNYPYTCWVCR